MVWVGTYSSWGIRRKETLCHGGIKVVFERVVVADAAIRGSDGPDILDRPLRTCWEGRGRRGYLFEDHKVEMEWSDEEMEKDDLKYMEEMTCGLWTRQDQGNNAEKCELGRSGTLGLFEWPL